MGYRRGFKRDANAAARDIRAELGLSDLDKLDPWALAAYRLVPVESLSDYARHAPQAVHHFTAVDPGAFSARGLRVLR